MCSHLDSDCDRKRDIQRGAAADEDDVITTTSIVSLLYSIVVYCILQRYHGCLFFFWWHGQEDGVWKCPFLDGAWWWRLKEHEGIEVYIRALYARRAERESSVNSLPEAKREREREREREMKTKKRRILTRVQNKHEDDAFSSTFHSGFAHG